jgi:multifunctional methyltransferase subunit TRM112
MTNLPDEYSEALLEDEKFMVDLHLLLCKRQVVEGAMKCPHCGRIYEIKNGIPNMLLDETEV